MFRPVRAKGGLPDAGENSTAEHHTPSTNPHPTTVEKVSSCHVAGHVASTMQLEKVSSCYVAGHVASTAEIEKVSSCHVAGHVPSTAQGQSVQEPGSEDPPGSTTSQPTLDIQERESQAKCAQCREPDQQSCTGCMGKGPVSQITSKSHFLTLPQAVVPKKATNPSVLFTSQELGTHTGRDESTICKSEKS